MKKILIYSLLLLPLVGWGQDFISQFPYHKKTEYFDFYYLRESPRILETARFADGFVKLLNRDFFTADFAYVRSCCGSQSRAPARHEWRRGEMNLSDDNFPGPG